MASLISKSASTRRTVFGGLRYFAFDLAVDFKARRSRKAEKLCFRKIANYIFVHIAELTAVAFVNDKYDWVYKLQQPPNYVCNNFIR